MKYTESQILDWLQEVKDPEIPVLSVVDLGVITKVQIPEDERVVVTMTPTFAGCPAIDVMQSQVRDCLLANGVLSPEVELSFEIPWSSDRITEAGKQALKRFGLALPGDSSRFQADIDLIEKVACPHCGSEETELQSFFGPTLCRAIHYCNACKQAFEQFKTL